MDHTAGFVEEIDFKELKFGEVVGRGAFGVVSKAKWGSMDVAVKLIETESEKKAFITELTQLSRINHPNIVKLYGACTKQPVCLVMEYAEGGSLYNVLHGEGPQPTYTAAHAMSWCLQCACGVEYLHGMKPKPLIHRDLKPPNLLLISGGTTLKICDFGTACDAHTHMTNNKGSAAWMAPEVFEGCNYSEKCDVFSWGIILWEVITRRKPFDEIGGPAFRIMWAVHNGKRPPLVQKAPKPVEILMTRCWAANPVERPSMSEVVRIMTHLFQFFTGADEPLMYPQLEENERGPFECQTSSVFETPPPTNRSGVGCTDGPSIHETVRMALIGDAVPLPRWTPKANKPIVVEEDHKRRTSAPASLAASQESLLDKSSRSSTPSIDLYKRYSADLTRQGEIDFVALGANIPPNRQPFVKGHRRTGSHDLPVVSSGASPVPGWFHTTEVPGHRRSGSYGNSPVASSSADVAPVAPPLTSTPNKPSNIHHSVTSPANLDTMNWEPGAPIHMANILRSGMSSVCSSDTAEFTMAMVAMDHQLQVCTPEERDKCHNPAHFAGNHVVYVYAPVARQPLAPCPTSPDSIGIFQRHWKLAEEHIVLQTEIYLLTQKKHELTQELELNEQEQQASSRLAEQYQRLTTENEQLMMLQENLQKQVTGVREEGMRRSGNV